MFRSKKARSKKEKAESLQSDGATPTWVKTGNFMAPPSRIESRACPFLTYLTYLHFNSLIGLRENFPRKWASKLCAPFPSYND
jgi:hypothetical protein